MASRKCTLQRTPRLVLRAGELYALEVPDIDFPRNVIHVRRAVWEGQRQSTKTRNATRAVDVQPSLIFMIREYLNGRKDGLVFPSKKRQTTPQQ